MLCGEIYSMKPHPENPKRWRKAKLCRTADQEKIRNPSKKLFNKTVFSEMTNGQKMYMLGLRVL